MASEAQTNANRENAQKSTGPTTAEGKARSSQNSLKHGAYVIEAQIAGIDPQVFLDREKQYFDLFQLKNPLETFHVKAMIAAENEHDICVAIRPYTLKSVIFSKIEDSKNPIGDGVVEDAKRANALEKLGRRLNQAYGRWVRSANELRLLQRLRIQSSRPTAVPPQPAPETDSDPETPSHATEFASQEPDPASD